MENRFRVQDSRPPRPPKLFVLDTNVILHDSRCIFNFQDNDIYIPVSVIRTTPSSTGASASARTAAISR